MSLHRLKTLYPLLIKHACLYYEHDRPEISDTEYDKLFREALELEKQFPEAIDPSSPTQRVGGKLSAYLPSRPHVHPMLSLDNIFNIHELADFIKRTGGAELFFDLKMDGIAISIIYVYGVFEYALTRGNGKVGEDVTANVRAIGNVPKYVSDLAKFPYFEVRGEAVMPKAALKRVNAILESKGKEGMINCRNAAGGAIRGLDPKTVQERGIQFYAYSVPEVPEDMVGKHGLLLGGLMSMGFDVSVMPGRRFRTAKTVEEAEEAYQEILKARPDLPFDIDGVVFKVDEFAVQKKLGFTGRFPKWAGAYKFPSDKAKSKLLDIIYQVGRTGAVTPVAKIEPVFVGGVTISSVTLHNADEFARLELKHGATVVVERAGDVIPKIIEAYGGDASVEFTPVCPSCGGPLTEIEEQAKIFCTDQFGCSGQILRSLSHFVSRDAMDINDLSEKRLKLLLEAGLIKTPADLFTLDFKRDKVVEQFGETMTRKILAHTDGSKTPPLNKFLFALGIREVGTSTAMELAIRYGSIEAIQKAPMDDLMLTQDVGDVVASFIVEYFAEGSKTRQVVDAILLNGVVPAPLQIVSKELEGKTFVVTGSFGLDRSTIKERLKLMGATVTGSVSKKTTVLVAGEGAGAKLKSAQNLGIEIWDEDKLNAVFD